MRTGYVRTWNAEGFVVGVALREVARRCLPRTKGTFWRRWGTDRIVRLVRASCLNGLVSLCEALIVGISRECDRIPMGAIPVPNWVPQVVSQSAGGWIGQQDGLPQPRAVDRGFDLLVGEGHAAIRSAVHPGTDHHSVASSSGFPSERDIYDDRVVEQVPAVQDGHSVGLDHAFGVGEASILVCVEDELLGVGEATPLGKAAESPHAAPHVGDLRFRRLYREEVEGAPPPWDGPEADAGGSARTVKVLDVVTGAGEAEREVDHLGIYTETTSFPSSSRGQNRRRAPVRGPSSNRAGSPVTSRANKSSPASDPCS